MVPIVLRFITRRCVNGCLLDQLRRSYVPRSCAYVLPSSWKFHVGDHEEVGPPISSLWVKSQLDAALILIFHVPLMISPTEQCQYKGGIIMLHKHYNLQHTAVPRGPSLWLRKTRSSTISIRHLQSWIFIVRRFQWTHSSFRSTYGKLWCS